MTYLEAKIELQEKAPKVPFKLLSLEAAVFLLVAYALVQVFA